jgi:hypothetical protein
MKALIKIIKRRYGISQDTVIKEHFKTCALGHQVIERKIEDGIAPLYVCPICDSVMKSGRSKVLRPTILHVDFSAPAVLDFVKANKKMRKLYMCEGLKAEVTNNVYSCKRCNFVVSAEPGKELHTCTRDGKYDHSICGGRLELISEKLSNKINDL